ncbi:MAG: helix-turn-helix domain-containing protein [Oscillospiraceae bacterium]|nr:helix-turn-helix domain-containing protein [Oscillospiraceae bacterium]
MEEITFGAFVREKRKEKGISLRRLTELLEMSPVHLSNLENDRRPAPKEDMLRKMIEVLRLDHEEQTLLFELAAKSKAIPSVPQDLPEYIAKNELARVALRTAKETGATDKEWQDFINKLKKRKGQGGY